MSYNSYASTCSHTLIDATDAYEIVITAVGSRIINDYAFSFEESQVIATNAHILRLQCIADNLSRNGWGTCDRANVSLAQRNYLLCDQAQCRLNLFTEEPSLGSEQLNVSINQCQICSEQDEHDVEVYHNFLCSSRGSIELALTCGASSDVFTENGCVHDTACCREDMFDVTYGYDACDWDYGVSRSLPARADGAASSLLGVGVLILVAVLLAFAFATVGLASHLRSARTLQAFKAVMKPPSFIFAYVHMIDFLIHLTLFYLLWYVIMSASHIRRYCDTFSVDFRGRLSDTELMSVQDLSDASGGGGGLYCMVQEVSDEHIVYEPRIKYTLPVFCIACVLFYFVYGVMIYRSLELFDGEEFWVRYWQVSAGADMWNDIMTKYNNVKYYGTKCYACHRISRYFFLAVAIATALVDIHVNQMYETSAYVVVYPMIFSYLIICEMLKKYYRSLSAYNEISIVAYVVLSYCGQDIGMKIVSFLYPDWTPKQLVSYRHQASMIELTT
eukprot:CAMPEP_0202726156 /NCGR_PEP_ID=MMETSP1385-20130828/184468_1 /ASSEMBLY_ACC=CAM_ASM_000861 /TAXON_ID=933848 /ORGANISM="Elphidium margaritaceum" /LENGTH=501 /DNA_ID=CAMNT_0049392369 /DNA_START=821 /DNA_END=2322 /DNA_ORIENTATION=-